ncbi:collagen-like protein [Bacillus thuringiensis]|uniref:Collagen-like protein n=2 Tax=Bacillus cereus group TaxID=86661 RepID=A0A9X6JPH2_BACUK|nr:MULTISPECIES: hypothetical protein [Bacillus cereus group]KAB5632725.1 collagen-like protein [Bacillus thuringiensis]MBY0037300.1 collagen-like protein [Bacillus cereus]MEC2870709.1 collagen-like protein [Bacillus cereus]OTZ71638.1 hypothetical protein BK769_16800 [Bacillus thuringiensis serovar kumamtoensis]OTZ71728.1 hypothetical protein BK769_16725 [Bacillus thuringiensis serovar kumamtoensis]
MSQSNIPNITPTISLTREESINLLLASIALEELGLAHIINAEAEKIQVALGTIPGLSPFPTLSDILAINESVNTTLKNATKKEMLLQSKLESILQAPSFTGPTGATGATGTSGIAVANQYLTSDGVSILAPANSDFVFDTNGSVNGTDITHTPGTSVFTLAPGHTYQVIFTISAASQVTGLLWNATLNNAIVGTPAKSFVVGSFSSSTGYAYVVTPLGPPSTLTIRNTSATLDIDVTGTISILELF